MGRARQSPIDDFIVLKTQHNLLWAINAPRQIAAMISQAEDKRGSGFIR
jgi:hypothetical protein